MTVADSKVPEPPLGDTPPLRLTFDGPLAVLTIDRPPENVFDRTMLERWGRATEWLTQNPPRALLINAHGRVVSTGLDVTILDELSHQYILSYVSTAPPDGSWRTLQIHACEGCQVRAREGYRAAEP